MSLWSRLGRILVGGEEPEPEEILPRLRRLYAATVERQRSMLRHAELAPNEASREGLTKLAEEEKELAERLRELVARHGGFAGDVPAGEPPPPGLNHWSRLVQDLEAHRSAVKELLDHAADLTDDEPELAEALRELARREEIHVFLLRRLVARADPQAID
ncbi:MAG: hypothetical protein KatS3mg076_1892 [Candidatus Binatia bacterium]|nr:MAG: hypothetical protein KatS3mg076_1892 [Candidatus Binatia bacterium]